MLVLQRKQDESIVVTASNGEKVTIIVSEIDRRGRVKLAFDAPPQVKIFRTELLEDDHG